MIVLMWILNTVQNHLVDPFGEHGSDLEVEISESVLRQYMIMVLRTMFLEGIVQLPPVSCRMRTLVLIVSLALPDNYSTGFANPNT